jgi:putative ABC transport system permease protein
VSELTTFLKSCQGASVSVSRSPVRAEIAPFSPVDDMPRSIASANGLHSEDFRVTAAQSFVTVDARQIGGGTAKADPYALRGLDEQFLDHTTFEFAAVADGYQSEREVWRALADRPDLAVVDASVVPRRRNWGFAPRPDFALRGFTLEDDHFAPPRIDVTDSQTGTRQELTVIGVLKDSAPISMAGISTSQATLTSFGPRAHPTTYYFQLAEGVDADRLAKQLESAFLTNGMQAESTSKILDDAVGGSLLFQRLLLGFLGLGLVVGVAALAVVSARSVVERRQQIGVLRAIGFQRSMIRLSLLLEASFVALVAIGVGTVLGLIMAFDVIQDAARSPNSDTVTFAVPWVNLLVVFGVVYLAALISTSVPARKAARVYPAEALRYQ